ncbi:hypothetical protein Egran_05549 [Elaphomyces granulatus]|uniref:DUF676 domain-containing protein n=1 Tax=Elaphomyces granulatus TaxID=519963 RepID=A0A232LRH1_9EURO|nr:hypothetical protein Egran_05549 [Elaphomyces granulatus]
MFKRQSLSAKSPSIVSPVYAQRIPQVKDTGITILAEPPSDRGAIIDIVFVHGFNGHPRDTWVQEPSMFYWPWELRNVINEARIMMFGYDANIKVLAAKNLMGIRDHARNLLARLRNERAIFPISKRPLAFVCHSMGGLVVKEVRSPSLGPGGPAVHSISLNTKALFFFGTPHRGAAALDSKRLSLLINVSKLFFAGLPGDLETALKTRSSELFAINDEFRNIALLQENKLSITCFFERVETTGLGDVDSAALGYTGEEDVGILADHRGLVRYRDMQDDLYDFVTKTMLYKLDGILQESRKQQASSQLLGVFSGQIKLRELRKIPYLTEQGWLEAIPELGVTWDGLAQVGVARIGKYSETWMNLLLVFGAENIIASPYIRQLPINPDDLPHDLINPFAVELGIAAILAGIAGCDTMIFNGHSPPVFSGGNARLEFTQSGSNTWIGLFSQEPGMPAHWDYTARTVGRASTYATGTFFYGFEEPVPVLGANSSLRDRLKSQSGVSSPGAMSRDIIDLEFSWLASHECYRPKVGSGRRIKPRPKWTSLLNDTGLVVLEHVMLACDIYLRAGDVSVFYEVSTDNDKVLLHTSLSSQLQEVDWWLGTRQALAACEASNILSQMPIFGSGTTGRRPRASINKTSLTIFTERRLVRAMLVFRAVLVAMLLGLGLDNSAFEGTDLRTKIVLLR